MLAHSLCISPDVEGRYRGGTPREILEGENMPLWMRVHDREPIGSALRRFKKLLERSGLIKELRQRRHYEKPCEVRRRAKMRKQNAIRKGRMPAPTTSSYR
jgi:small subunit ribosomal protein S21